MSDKKLYKETFDSIQMSEEAFRKVINMNKNTKIQSKRTRKLYKVAAATVATLAFLLISGNAISYAATGNTLMENVTIYMNGEKVDDSKVKTYTDKNGATCYEVELDENDGGSGEMVVEIFDTTYSFGTDKEGENAVALEIVPLQGVVKQEEEQILLIIGDNLTKFDITDDFKDGNASGTFILDGVTYEYTIEGTIDNNTVNIQTKE